MKKYLIILVMVLSSVAFEQGLSDYQDMGSLSWGIKYLPLVGHVSAVKSASGDIHYPIGACINTTDKSAASVMIVLVDGINGRFLAFQIQEKEFARSSATVQCMSEPVRLFGNVIKLSETLSSWATRFNEHDIVNYCGMWGLRGVTGFNVFDLSKTTFERDLYKALRNVGWIK